MSRGRKPNPPAKPIDVQVNHEAVAQDLAAITEDAKRLNEIDALYGSGTPYNLETYIDKTISAAGTATEAVLNMGKFLIVIKEHEPHGRYLHALERIGIVPRASQKLMQAAVKFSSPQMRRLAAHFNKTKLLELLTEDEQELEALEKGGTLAGLTLDEVARMTKEELRAALRVERQKRKEDKETNERLLADKNKKIDRLAIRQQGLPAQLQELQIDCAKAALQIIDGIQKLTQIRLTATGLLNGNKRERNDDLVQDTVGQTLVQLLWTAQAHLSVEMGWTDEIFEGTKIELMSRGASGPALTDEQIVNLNKAGEDEINRVAGPRLAEELANAKKSRKNGAAHDSVFLREQAD